MGRVQFENIRYIIIYNDIYNSNSMVMVFIKIHKWYAKTQ